MLGRKHSITNEKWLETAANIKDIISENELKQYEADTVEDILMKTKGKKAAYAYSGGKDSIVLSGICEKAGINFCMMGTTELEYPAFIDWINQNKPKNLEIINTGQDIQWLVKNQNMLFPDSKKAARWFNIVQHKAQTLYFKTNDLDILITGRRKADGNYVGKDNIYTNGKGVTYYSPLAHWKHEHVLACISCNNLRLPPIYEWVNGYKCGTHPWPARQHVKNHEQGWREIYSIDPNIVKEAAEAGIESAKEFLKSI